MKVGVVIPQGLEGEFAGWEPAAAWRRTEAVARAADNLGFDAAWVYDHLGTFGTVRDEPTFEAFATLGALVGVTERIRLGPLVARAGFRNPALLAKHVASLDVASGGRFELGMGAGGTLGEALAFGYRVPDLAGRMRLLEDDLAILRPLFHHGRATYAGDHASVDDAINNPRGLQLPAIPILIGGNSRMAWRLAARFADEVNLDGTPPARMAEAQATLAALCEEAGRDPATLAVSVHVLPDAVAGAGAVRVDLLAAYRETGVSRLMALVRASVASDEALASFAEDARAVGAVV